MVKTISFLFILLGHLQLCSCAKQKTCSQYDFAENVLEKVVRIELKMETMTETVNELSKQVKDDINKMKADWTDTKKEFELMIADVTEREHMLNDTIQKAIQDFSAKLQKSYFAFSAYNLSATTSSRADTIVFTQTMLNEDGVYSTTTGMFTAPRDGVYEFHATLVAGEAKKGVWVEFKAFKAGETIIGRFSSWGYYHSFSFSGSAIARLQEGTHVYLKISSVQSTFKFNLYSALGNTFSGHLISN